MADETKPAETKPADKPTPARRAEPEVVDGTRRFSAADEDGPSKAEKELADLGVDPRLDNRTGDARPQKVEWPAKHQQVDGPSVVDDFAEHAEAVGSHEYGVPTEEVLGQWSEGPHGLGEDVGGTVSDGKHANKK